MFDFSKTEAAKVGITPGIYSMHPTGAKFVQPEGTKLDGSPKTPYMEVNFQGKAGTVREKFYLTTAAANRLQYLHEELYGQPLGKAFEKPEQVAAYFDKAFKAKQVEKKILVRGKEAADGKVWPELGYSGFVVENDAPEGAFPVDSFNYTQNVTKSVDAPKLAGGEVMPGGPNSATTAQNVQDSDDLPF